MAESDQELSPEMDDPNETSTVSGPTHGLATSSKTKSNTRKFLLLLCSFVRGY